MRRNPDIENELRAVPREAACAGDIRPALVSVQVSPNMTAFLQYP
jgi:hypothetical protein